MQFTRTNPNVDLELSTIAMEANVLTNMVSSIRNTFPSLLNKLTSSFDTVKDIPINNPSENQSISKEHNFVLSGIDRIAYLDLAEFRVHTPEGFAGSLVDYSLDMVNIAKSLRGINSQVLHPYNIYLSQFISNKDAKLSIKDLTPVYASLAKKRDAAIISMDNYRSGDTSTSSAKLGKVIGRKNDLNTLFRNTENLNHELNIVDLKIVQHGVKNCVDLLNIIVQQVEEGVILNVTPEVTKNLAFGATEIAREIEFLAMVHFRALGLKSSVQNITEVLTKYIKGIH